MKRREVGTRRVSPPAVPTYIRAAGVELGPNDRASIRRKLAMKLGKFARAIERVSVRVDDVNGPRGGVDHHIRIKVVLRRLPSVVYERKGASLWSVIDRAIDGANEAVRRSVRRRRTAPIRQRGRGKAR